MSRESPTLKKGDMIVIEDARNLKKPIVQFYKKWGMLPSPSPATGTPTVTRTVTTTAMETATENETGKKVKLKYRGSDWKPFENNRLIGIVTGVFSEELRDFDVIKVREQTGGVRYCRRYILENV